MADLYALSERDVERLRALLDAFESGRLNALLRPGRQSLDGPTWCRLAQSSGMILQAVSSVSGSGTIVTPGAGPVELNSLDPTNHYALLDQGLSQTAYNPGTNPVAPNTTVALVREALTGQDLILPFPRFSGCMLGLFGPQTFAAFAGSAQLLWDYCYYDTDSYLGSASCPWTTVGFPYPGAYLVELNITMVNPGTQGFSPDRPGGAVPWPVQGQIGVSLFSPSNMPVGAALGGLQDSWDILVSQVAGSYGIQGPAPVTLRCSAILAANEGGGNEFVFAELQQWNIMVLGGGSPGVSLSLDGVTGLAIAPAATLAVTYLGLPSPWLPVQCVGSGSSGSGSGSGSGSSGSGGSGSISSTELGTASTGGTQLSSLSIFGVSVSSHDLLVVKAAASTPITAVSIGGKSLTKVASQTNPANSWNLTVWELAGGATGTLTVTYTANSYGMVIAESVSGLASNALDVQHGATGSVGSPDTGSITTTVAAEFVTAVVLLGGTTTCPNGTWSAGFTADQSASATQVSSLFCMQDADRITSSTGSYDASLSGILSGTNWAAIILGFK